MALADRQIEAKGPGKACSIGYALENLPDDDRDWLVRSLGTKERRGKDASVIWGTMHDERRDLIAQADELEGAAEPSALDLVEAQRLRELAEVYNIGFQTVNRHRGEGCRCFRSAA